VVGGAGEAVSLFGVVFKFEEKQQQASVFGEKQQWLLLMILSQKEPRSRFF